MYLCASKTLTMCVPQQMLPVPCSRSVKVCCIFVVCLEVPGKASSLLTVVPDQQGDRALLWPKRPHMKLLLPFVYTHTVNYLCHHTMLIEALLNLTVQFLDCALRL